MRYVVIFSLVLVLGGCSGGLLNSTVKEGVIKYDITYQDQANSTLGNALLPSEMELFFRKDLIMNRFQGAMEMYGFSYITDWENNANSLLFQIKSSKYLYQTPASQVPLGLEGMGAIEVQELEGTKQIAGYDCKKAKLIFNNGQKPVKIYYSDKIQFDEPNLNNLFGKIDGVLFEYRFKINSLDMTFCASEVRKKNLPNDFFQPPPDAEKVNKRIMQNLLSTKFL